MAFIAGKHSDRCLKFLFGMFNTPTTPWQIGPPLGQVPVHCPSSPSGPYVLPLSALSQQHVKTSHVGLLTGGESLTPTRGIHQEKARHLLYAQILLLRFPFL